MKSHHWHPLKSQHIVSQTFSRLLSHDPHVVSLSPVPLLVDLAQSPEGAKVKCDLAVTVIFILHHHLHTRHRNKPHEYPSRRRRVKTMWPDCSLSTSPFLKLSLEKRGQCLSSSQQTFLTERRMDDELSGNHDTYTVTPSPWFQTHHSNHVTKKERPHRYYLQAWRRTLSQLIQNTKKKLCYALKCARKINTTYQVTQ